MTILTKPFGDKKPENKITVPLVDGGIATNYDLSRDAESDNLDNIIHVHRRSLPTLFLLLIAMFVMGLGILGGVYVYRQYAHARMQRLQFHGFCGVPYDSSSIDNKALIFMNNKWRDDNDGNIILDPSVDIFNPIDSELSRMDYEINDNFFREEFELVLSDDENYSKINVPDFRDGRRGRFLHDFKNNQSSIIDKDSNRCFVMPLDRETVLPPRSLYDLVTKMWNGYYDIDTDVVRKDFRVIMPAITDLSPISSKIAHECQGMKIYMLEKFISGVYKRSADLPETAKYAEFSGKLVQFDIVNINELDAYEASKPNA